jgi:TorA maturation chaperone TorD
MMNDTLLPLNNRPQERAFSLLAQVAQGRSEVYRWLALSFYPPDSHLVNALQKNTFLVEIQTATSWLGTDQQVLVQCIQKILERVRSLEFITGEYERLSGKGVSRIPMIESAYRWREASNPLTDHASIINVLQQEYALYGISSIALEPDHIAVQLEFLAYLSQHEAFMWRESERDAARQLRRIQNAFLTDHLGQWMPELSRRIHEQMPESIYTSFAALASAWIRMEYGPGYFAELES